MILDGEEDKAMRVLLEQRLLGLDILDARSHLGSFLSLVGDLVRLQVDVRRACIFLAGNVEVDLLDGRVTHFEILEGGSSLRKEYR